MIEETVAEIVAASKDGNILIYTNSPNGKIGFIDISVPPPLGLGILNTAGKPISIAVSSNHVLVDVITSASFTNPSGILAAYNLPACLFDISKCMLVREIGMGGQFLSHQLK